jgi:hypothetical protein
MERRRRARAPRRDFGSIPRKSALRYKSGVSRPTKQSNSSIPQAPLRPAETVMRASRLGSFHPTRLSFSRSLIRRMAREHWRFRRTLCELDSRGFGRMVYEIETSKGLISFAAFSNYLAPEDRTDRVIAEKWDAAFALSAGRLGAAALDRLAVAAPKQEAARFSADEFVLSRANKSVRLFDGVARTLAEGRQPALADVVKVGYLMRTTAVYGNGKFGLADLSRVWRDGIFSLPYEAEMLMVYMIRRFSFDLIEHVARQIDPSAVPLSGETKRALGIGNATGLGMAPFLVGHPALFNNWITARETALARVRAVEMATTPKRARFAALLDRAIGHAKEWTTDDEGQMARIEKLRGELTGLRGRREDVVAAPRPWDRLVREAEAGGLEFSELINSLVIELYPELVDDLERTTGSPERESIDAAMTLAGLRSLIEASYGWALKTDYAPEPARHFFWYRSAEKDEPRLGERFNEPGASLELPIGIGFMAAALHRDLSALPEADRDRMNVGEYLLRHPRWRGIARRIQSLAHLPYAEIHDNLLGHQCLPIDMLRCKLSIFGAAKFDPKSDRWTRITLFQGAPEIEELAEPGADDWAFPHFLS